MKTALAIDSSSETTFVALRERSGNILEASAPCKQGGSHSEVLSALVERLLEQADLEVREIQYLAYGMGPGSFTGLRIGLSYIQGLNFISRQPVCGACSLAACAYEFAESSKHIVSAARSGRDTVYMALFEGHAEGAITELIPPIVLKHDQILETVKERNFKEKESVWIGNGTQLPGVVKWISPQHVARSVLLLANSNLRTAISIEELSQLALKYVAPINAKTIAERQSNIY